MRFFFRIFALTVLIAIIGGVAFVMMSDVPVKQEMITKTIPSDGLLNDE